MPSICQCGAQASYPHAADCPYPYFGENEEKIEAWLAARREMNAPPAISQGEEGLDTILPKLSVSNNKPMTMPEVIALVERVGATYVQIYWAYGDQPMVQDFSDPLKWADPLEPVTLKFLVDGGIFVESPRSSKFVKRYLHFSLFAKGVSQRGQGDTL